jgi:hypothetical protein
LLGIGNHRLGRFALGVAICGGDHGTGNQTVAVDAQGVANETQLNGSVAFAVEPRIGIGAGFVGVVAAALQAA